VADLPRGEVSIVVSLSVKSVTAPVAVAMMGPVLMDRIGVSSPIARGLALGTISAGQGTAQAAQESELSGAVAGMAMGIAAVFMSLVAPQVIRWL
jgi:putative effector of murein hydrolase